MPRRGELRGPGDVSPFFAEGRAPSFVALHGFTGTVSEIRPLAERVAAAGYHVRAPILAGHGTTARELQSRRFEDWVESARAELDRAAERGPVVLCGFSMGSLVALHLAADPQTRRSVAGLVLLGCALRLAGPLRAAFALAERTGLALPDAYVPKPFGPDVRDPRARDAITHYTAHPVRAAMEVYRAGRALSTRLGEIRCPALVLHGALDRVCSVRGAREVVAGLGTRDVRLRVLERSAHVVALDYDREQLEGEVLAFVERVAQLRPVEP